MPSFELITFDVFTALFDIRSSLLPKLGRVLPVEAGLAGILETWRRRQMEYALISNSLEGTRIPFTTITQRALEYSLHQAGMTIPSSEQENLVEAWDKLVLWPEARVVLTEIAQRGFRLALLSNGDQRTLETLAERLPVAVEAVFSCETAGFYKPHPEVYRLPVAQSGLSQSRILHVAGSPTDVMGARSAGLPCYWSNRNGARLLDQSLQPTFESDNLLELLEVL